MVVLRRQQVFVDLSHHHFGEDFTRLDRLKSDVTPHCGPNAPMAQNLSDEFKLARSVFEDDGAGGMPELMDRHFQSGRFLDVPANLDAE